MATKKKTDETDQADQAAAQPNRGPSPGLEAFRTKAMEQAERIPSATLAVAEGQYLVGKVKRTAVYVHQKWGDSPVIVFDPDEQDTNVPACLDGTPVAELEPDKAYTFVGIGTVAQKLVHVAVGDRLLILGLEPGESSLGRYANYEFVVGRDGREPIPLETLIRQAAMRGEIPRPVSTQSGHPEEEPF